LDWRPLGRVKREKAVRLLENHAYGTLVWLGECEEGHPIFTFTLHPEAITDTYKASPPYLEKLALGACSCLAPLHHRHAHTHHRTRIDVVRVLWQRVLCRTV
jgi:hypothetical protein